MSESYQVNFDLQLGETTRMSYLQQAHYPFTVQRGYILHMFPPHILQIHNHQNTINLTLLLLIFSKWYKKKILCEAWHTELPVTCNWFTCGKMHISNVCKLSISWMPLQHCKNWLILWIIFFSKAPTFVVNQNFTGSLRRNFVGNRFVALQCKMIHYFFRRPLGCMFVVKGNSRNSRTLIPHKQWWFHSKYGEHTVLVSKKKC